VTFQIKFKPSAIKELEGLPRLMQGRILDRITALADDPRPPGHQKLAGLTQAFRVRLGDFRIVYAIVGRLIWILKIGDRKNVYRDLKAISAFLHQVSPL
jgi:mRNA interferase RelE/StbE